MAEMTDDHFDDLYREFAPLMRGVAIRRFGIPFDEAEALAHDILLSYLAHPAVVRGQLRPYFISAAWNASRAYLRKRRPERPLDGVEEPRAETETFVSDELERYEAVLAAMEQTTEKCRTSLRLFYLESQSGDQLATALCVSREKVHQILHGCRARLRAIVESMLRPAR